MRLGVVCSPSRMTLAPRVGRSRVAARMMAALALALIAALSFFAGSAWRKAHPVGPHLSDWMPLATLTPQAGDASAQPRLLSSSGGGGSSSSNSSSVGRDSSADTGSAVAVISHDTSSSSGGGGGGGSGRGRDSFKGRPRSTAKRTECYLDPLEAASDVAVNDTIILTVVNEAMLHFARNWLAHLTDTGATNILIGVYEAQTAQTLLEWGTPCLNMTELVEIDPKGGFGWGDPNWRKTSWSRCFIIPEIMRSGYHLIWSDIDVVWFRNPTEMLPLHPEVDMVMGSDHIATSLAKGDAYFERPAFAFDHQFNAGITFLRNSRRMIDLMDAWKVEMDAGRQKMNQDALNKELLRAGIPKAVNVSSHLAKDNDRVMLAFRDTIRLGILPTSVLMTGRTYMLQQLHTKLKVEPWSLHLTWIWGKQSGKLARLQEARMWRGEPPDSPWYGGSGGDKYLAMDLVQPQVPYDRNGVVFGDWDKRARDMEAYHLAAVEFQLSQIWYGWNLALALNRTFIMPKMACFCDHNWVRPWQCRSPPAWVTNTGPRKEDFDLPYACPLDFIFEPVHMLEGDEWGPPLPHRFNSFLTDPQLHPSVRASQLRLRTSPDVKCAGGKCADAKIAECEAGARPQGAGNSGTTTVAEDGKEAPLLTKCIPPGLDSQQLPAALKSVESVRVLHIGDAPVAWGGWKDAEMAKAVRKRMDHSMLYWMGRWKNAAKEYGRNETEPYFWRPFTSVDEVYLKAVKNNGALDVARVLADRPQPWPMNNSLYVFKGEHVPASLWL